jgi:nitroreductase
MDYSKKYLKLKNKYDELKNKSFMNNLIWRRSEKTFLPGEVDLESIKKAIINSPSSYGMQPYKVYLVTDQNTKERLREACKYQKQAVECHGLFIFCAIKDAENRMNQYIKETGGERKRIWIIEYLAKLPDKLEWCKRQAYIALGFAMASATELKIASCPMEGFDPTKVSKVLNLNDNYEPCVLLAVGKYNPLGESKLEPRFRFKDIIEEIK